MEKSGLSRKAQVLSVVGMDTKAKGDIGEQAAVLQAMRMGWAVLKPLGDRMPYDLVFDLGGRFAKIQVKTAWFNSVGNSYYCDSRRTKTNRREMKREYYDDGDFDFALIYVDSLDKFFVMPSSVFNSYASSICLQCCGDRQRESKSKKYFGAWWLINKWAAPEETRDVESVKVGEAVDMVIPSQALDREGVET